MTKLIAIDLDGTLLSHEKTISQENLEALLFAHEQGVMIVIATGRTYHDVKNILEPLNLPFTPWVISANGSIIHHPNGEKVHSVPITKESAEAVLKWLEDEEYYYEVSVESRLLAPTQGKSHLAKEAEQLKRINPSIKIEVIEQAIENQFRQTGFEFVSSKQDITGNDEDIYNILALSFHDEKLMKGKEAFKGKLGVNIFSSGKNNFEFVHEHASKGKALEKLGEILQIPLLKMAAVGDNYNDISMLTMVGRSAAMGNADDAVKEKSHEVTLENHEHGVAHFIYRLLKQ
jgi:Cof subfamily protein (haloacid dehalogenase superfamily)